MARGGVFKLSLRNHMGEVVEALEGAISRAADIPRFFGGKNGPMSKAWAASRREMFLTQGQSTQTPWAPYIPEEQRYYLPRKAAALKTRTANLKPGVLRFTKDPASARVGALERLYPAMTRRSHAEYVWETTATKAWMGTNVPYAWTHDKGGIVVTFKSRRHASGQVSYTLPQRRLVVFGPVFIESVRQLMARWVAADLVGSDGKIRAGGRVGLSTKEVLDRIASARSDVAAEQLVSTVDVSP